jgi:hypothetical protein
MDGLRKVLFIGILVSVLGVPHAFAEGESRTEASRCLACHAKAGFETEREGSVVSLSVDPATIESSVHSGARCTSCHIDAADLPHKKEIARVKCGNCHENQELSYEDSIHGMDFTRGEKDVPGRVPELPRRREDRLGTRPARDAIYKGLPTVGPRKSYQEGRSERGRCLPRLSREPQDPAR